MKGMRGIMAGACWALLLVGCGAEREAPVDAGASLLAPTPQLVSAAGEVVAEVDGHAITRAQLEAVAARAPGAPLEAVLERLINEALLAAEAQRRGLDAAPEVRHRLRQAMVQRLLEVAVEEVAGAAQLEEAFVREVYENYALDVFEPELVVVSHLLVEDPAATRTPESLAAAEALARALRQALIEASGGGAPTRQSMDLVGLRANLQGPVVRVEHDLTFPRQPARPVQGRSRFLVPTPAFAEAAFALGADAPLSEPVVTEYGVHVLRLHARQPAIRPPFEAVRETIARELVRLERERLAEQMIDGLLREAALELDPGPLGELAARLFQQE